MEVHIQGHTGANLAILMDISFGSNLTVLYYISWIVGAFGKFIKVVQKMTYKGENSMG